MKKPSTCVSVFLACLAGAMLFSAGCDHPAPPPQKAARPAPPPPPPPAPSPDDPRALVTPVAPGSSFGGDVESQKKRSWRNLKQIGLGVHLYGAANHRLPPAYIASSDGKPLLSWRVLVLPYLEGGDELAKQFHLDEPWDTEHNKTLIPKIPYIYADPAGRLVAEGKTHYLTVRNDDALFPTPSDGKGIRFSDVTDGLSNTIMTIEVSDEKAVIWTKPDDLTYDEDDPMKGVVGLWPNGFFIGMGDGFVRFMSSSIQADVFKALFTRNGGESITLP